MFAVEITESAESDLDQINNDCYLEGLGDEPNVDDAFAFGVFAGFPVLNLHAFDRVAEFLFGVLHVWGFFRFDLVIRGVIDFARCSVFYKLR